MNKKYIAYAILPTLALGFVGIGAASAKDVETNHMSRMSGGLMMQKNMSPDERANMHAEMFASQANLLGISTDEVKTAWAEGKTLLQLAEEKGITPEMLQQKLQAQRHTEIKAHIQSLVDKGVITQDQATKRLATMETKRNDFKTNKITKNFRAHGNMLINSSK